MRDQEIEIVLEEVEIRNLEFEFQKKMFEQVMGIIKDVKKKFLKVVFLGLFELCDYFSYFIVNFKYLI